MKSNSVSRRRTFFAAVRVLLARPAVLLIIAALCVQIGFLVFAVSEGHRTSKTESGIPSHEPDGERLWSVSNDMYDAYQRDQVDPSIQWLHLDYLDIEQTDGKTVVQFRNESTDSESTADDNVQLSVSEFADFLKRIPHIEWVSLRSEQLQALPTELLNDISELKSVSFNTEELTDSDLEGLSRLTNIENLSVEAAWCEGGLSQLAALPNLKSLHLKSLHRASRRRRSAPVTTRPLVSIENISSVMELPVLEELAVQDNGELFNAAFLTGLTSDNRDEYERFVETIKRSSTLQTIYAGYLQGPRSADLFEQMSEEVAHLSVYPAWFNSELAGWATMGNLASCLGLVVLTVHLVTCTGGAQNCLLNGANPSHLKVYLAGVAVFLVLPIITSLLRTHADWLSIVTFEGSLFAVATMFGLMRGGSLAATPDDVSLWKRLTPLLVFPAAALFVFVLIGSKMFEVQVARFFCGRFPIQCVVVLASTVIIVRANLKHFLNMHRVMAENGVNPASSWAEYSQVAALQYEMLLQQAEDKANAKNGTTNRKEDAWQVRLKSIVEQLNQKPESVFAGCRFWLAAGTSLSSYRKLVLLCLMWPLYTAWPALLPFLKGNGNFAAFANPAQLGLMMGGMIFLFTGAVVMHLYSRRSMFESEILKPVTRSTWRNRAVQSLLFATGLIILTSWSQVTLLRLIVGQSLPLNWIVLSFVSVFATALLTTGLNLWALAQSHVVAAALLVIAGLAASAPLMSLSIPGREEFLHGGSSQFAIWLAVVIGELILGSVAFKTAWTKWGNLELAQQSA